MTAGGIGLADAAPELALPDVTGNVTTLPSPAETEPVGDSKGWRESRSSTHRWTIAGRNASSSPRY
jgi:hypothetical protein